MLVFKMHGEDFGIDWVDAHTDLEGEKRLVFMDGNGFLIQGPGTPKGATDATERAERFAKRVVDWLKVRFGQESPEDISVFDRIEGLLFDILDEELKKIDPDTELGWLEG